METARKLQVQFAFPSIFRLHLSLFRSASLSLSLSQTLSAPLSAFNVFVINFLQLLSAAAIYRHFCMGCILLCA